MTDVKDYQRPELVCPAGTPAALRTAVDAGADAAHPVKTAYLTTPAMNAPWESLKVNNSRGLLAASPTGSPWLDVYSIAADCRHPICPRIEVIFVGRA